MSSRKKAKGGSVTDDMPSPSMLDGAALGATLDRIRVHCTTCDRPVATPREETTPRDQQNPAICYFNGGLACHKNEVDWRARCLAAEAENVRLVGCAVFAESVRDECENNERDFNNRGGQHVGRAPGMTVSTNHRLLRDARFALDGSQGKYSHAHWLFTNRCADLATSIARRALVEGLVECERLREALLAAFPPDPVDNTDHAPGKGGDQ